MFEFKITNIKLSVKTSFVCLDSVKVILKKKKIKFKPYPNFIVIKNKYTYIFFKSKENKVNHLNITSISNFDNIDYSVEHFFNMLDITSFQEIYRSVDNITASLNLNEKIDLLKIVAHFKQICNVSYNTEKFPGVFLKYKQGTIILFHTGKCIFIGCKNLYSIKYLETQVKSFFNTN